MRGLPRAVKSALEKASDSALLAVEVYNKPAVKFKSGGYIALMIIAWTSLFHAIFFRRKQQPYYKKPSGRYEKRKGAIGTGSWVSGSDSISEAHYTTAWVDFLVDKLKDDKEFAALYQ